jgi:putative ABC transport system substrate-binding protein
MPVIGFLGSATLADRMHLVTAFRQGLKDEGFIEGQNVTIEYRWAENQYDRLPMLAADLVHRQVAAIAATGGSVAVQAVKAATTTIPIIFVSGSDPVKLGLVQSLNRPTGNVTGASTFTYTLVAKRLQLLGMMLIAELVGMLVNPRNPDTDVELQEMQEAARLVGQRVLIVKSSTERDIDSAFTTLAKNGAGALIVGGGAFFANQRNQVVALAARNALPTSYPAREFAAAGGLMTYGSSLADSYRQAGTYIGKILKGTKPAELPVTQPTKFELVINLKTAKSLGLDIPPTLLSTADEVIE